MNESTKEKWLGLQYFLTKHNNNDDAKEFLLAINEYLSNFLDTTFPNNVEDTFSLRNSELKIIKLMTKYYGSDLYVEIEYTLFELLNIWNDEYFSKYLIGEDYERGKFNLEIYQFIRDYFITINKRVKIDVYDLGSSVNIYLTKSHPSSWHENFSLHINLKLVGSNELHIVNSGFTCIQSKSDFYQEFLFVFAHQLAKK